MPPFIDLAAKWGPPYLALYLLGFSIYKVARWMGTKLFDDENGLVVNWFHGQQKLFREQSAASNSIAASLQENKSIVQNVERRIDRIVASGNTESEAAHLIDILIDDTPVPMALTGEHGNYIRSNESVEDLLGYAKDELAGLTWQELTPRASDIAIDAEVCASIAAGRLRGDRIEKFYKRKDGTEVYCAVHIRRFPRRGPFRHFVCVIVPLSADRIIR